MIAVDRAAVSRISVVSIITSEDSVRRHVVTSRRWHLHSCSLAANVEKYNTFQLLAAASAGGTPLAAPSSCVTDSLFSRHFLSNVKCLRCGELRRVTESLRNDGNHALRFLRGLFSRPE